MIVTLNMLIQLKKEYNLKILIWFRITDNSHFFLYFYFQNHHLWIFPYYILSACFISSLPLERIKGTDVQVHVGYMLRHDTGEWKNSSRGGMRIKDDEIRKNIIVSEPESVIHMSKRKNPVHLLPILKMNQSFPPICGINQDKNLNGKAMRGELTTVLRMRQYFSFLDEKSQTPFLFPFILLALPFGTFLLFLSFTLH